MIKHKLMDSVVKIVLFVLTLIAILSLAFVVIFICKEAFPLFETVSIKEFIFGTKWMPIDFTGTTSFGIGNFILGTLYVSLLAMILALFISIGTALFLAICLKERHRVILYPFIDLLAGIPSVIYGFIGLEVLVPIFLRSGVHTGSCVLAAAIVLSIMLIPYMVSAFAESFLKLKNEYMRTANALGVDNWYVVNSIILPSSVKNLLFSTVLAIGRAMGETMAVMMVMGNANLLPKILGKGESIASLIALEMGTAVVGSTHYHALYAAGLVLMIMLVVINVVVSVIKKKVLK